MEAKHTPIPGWPGYLATPDGRIFADTNWRGYGRRELRQNLDRYGYPSVRLTVEAGCRKKQKVHSLIAATFLGARPSPRHEVRHLDGDALNNTVANLAWGTAAENAADRERHGRTSRGESHSMAIRQAIAASDNPYWRHAR